MLGKKIIVIGGSIAGCSSALLLQRLGAKVVIVEKSSGLISQGSGIVLPESVINQCIELDLFDKDIPKLDISARSFIRSVEHTSETFWNQSINVKALNWTDVYQNLRKRISPEIYHTKTEISHIRPMNDSGYYIETTDGKTYEADLIIAADGSDSITRNCLLPESIPEYTGYIAWRGMLDEQIFGHQSILDKHAPYYVFPNGHLLLYRIPAPGFQHTGKTLVNWIMYENRQGQPLNEFLIDNKGTQHKKSLPAGTLPRDHIEYLHKLSAQVLPTDIMNLIIQTQQPFIQAIFDFQLPEYSNNNIIFIGDAASTLRPHTASGVLKALQDAIKLYELIKNNKDKTMIETIITWKKNQQTQLADEVQKAKNLGDNLVKFTPNWNTMNQESTNKWWSEVMQGKLWYATATTSSIKYAIEESTSQEDGLITNNEANNAKESTKSDILPLINNSIFASAEDNKESLTLVSADEKMCDKCPR